MLTTCDKRDGQTFAGVARRPIGLGPMLCTSERHKIMQCSRIVDITAAEVVGGCVGESIMGRWSRFTGHMLLLALFTPCIEKLSKMQLYQAGHFTQTVKDSHSYITVFHLAGCLLM